jgi:hypothetical protein
MPSDNAAIVIACLSGAVSLAVAGGGAWAARRLAAWQNERTTELETLRSDQATQLETYRSEQAKELEGQRLAQDKELEDFREAIAQRRSAAEKAIDADELVAKYRNPLLRSAFDLQSRIYNVYRPGGFRGRADPEYFRLNTLFLFADFLGWLEIVRRELQFVDLGAVDATRKLARTIDHVQDRLASTSTLRDGLYIYRGHQRAIGEVMLSAVERNIGSGPRHECMGYAAFVEAQQRPEFARWFERLGEAVMRLPDAPEKPKRLIEVQHALIALIDFLDPDALRFDRQYRGKL